MNFQKPLQKILIKLLGNQIQTKLLDCIPLKVIKASANITDYHLTEIINKDRKIKYSEDAKASLVRPIYKTDESD